jgi:predicted phosphodiesterase
MRIAVVSDIHSNLAAFEAVIGAVGHDGPVDQMWCLGDLVGYGPDPGACIRLLTEYPHLCVAGNHDRAAAGMISTDEFNPVAAEAVTWTAAQLTDEARRYLAVQPELVVEDNFTLVHGSLRQPLWEYLVSERAAADHLALQATPYCFIGHSHLQLAFVEQGAGLPQGFLMHPGASLTLGDARIIANPGSVGQPRDGDPRAGYAVLDTDSATIRFHRVAYDIERTQRAMAVAGLPPSLIQRLAVGR